jgi:enoyl-CoA hydratase/carnithine racemase
MIEIEKTGDVTVLRMTNGENRFSFPFIERFNSLLDEIERSSGPAALVTVGEGKYYSNGIDLDWIQKESVDLMEFVVSLHGFFARILGASVPTVAALNGHAFAGGAMVALAHDFRVMRTDRGYFCMPEVDISIPFTEPLAALVRYKLTPQVAHRAMVTGHRYNAAEALASAVVDETASEEEVLPKAIALAQSLAGKDRSTLRAIKRNAARETLALLEGKPG